MERAQIKADGAIHQGTMLLLKNGAVVYAGPLSAVAALSSNWDEIVLSPQDHAQYVEFEKQNPHPEPVPPLIPVPDKVGFFKSWPWKKG